VFRQSFRQALLGDAVTACERGEAEGIVVAWQDRLSRESGVATAEVYEALCAAVRALSRAAGRVSGDVRPVS
jgi:hypothetical protein